MREPGSGIEQRFVDLATVEPNSGFDLRTTLLQDTIEVDDPIRLLYVIANDGEPAEFVNNPDWFMFRLESISGELVAVETSGSATGMWGSQVRMVLPRGSMLGQVTDLRCVSAPYSLAQSCRYSYDLRGPGEYRVVTMYREVVPPPSVVPRDREPLSLADTLTLVVRE